ncbi:hypothetical protein ACQP2F_18920 [Actinoplanes sp. CA-030573]|uniref:hypothetical protein n=1 Tax=Actinoplanes sp. CA-030573 TaxID=3239898 RepID=UPI003D8D9F73
MSARRLAVTGLPDVARVLHALEPDVDRMDLLDELLFGNREPPAVRPWTGSRAGARAGPGRPEVAGAESAGTARRAAPPPASGETPVAIDVEQLPRRATARAPRPGGSLADLLRPAPPPPPPPSLFRSGAEPALVRALAAMPLLVGEIDEARAVRRISRGQPLTVIPRRVVNSTARGLQVLADTAPEMTPYRGDVLRLLAQLRAIMPGDLVAQRWFARHPGDPQGVTAPGELLGRPYRRPPPGTPILVVTLFGRGAADPGLIGRWRRLVDDARRAGNPLTFLCPAEATPARRLGAPVIGWSTGTSVRTIRRAIRPARERT